MLHANWVACDSAVAPRILYHKYLELSATPLPVISTTSWHGTTHVWQGLRHMKQDAFKGTVPRRFTSIRS